MNTDSKVNILIVDDNEENLIAMNAVLEEIGENIVLANSGKKALRLLLDQDFSLILLDVDMPGMDGFEVATLIRQVKKLQHTPIIFLTALDQNESYLFKGYSVGAVDYIVKPVDPTVLKSKVKVFVELYRKTLEIKQQAELLEQTNRELDQLNKELEYRVLERTSELRAVNEKLLNEVEERKRAEKEREKLLEAEKAARAEAEIANKLRDEFLATVSHELRTPLSAIVGWTHLLRSEIVDAEASGRAIETIYRNAKVQQQLIEDLLDVSRIISGKLKIDKELIEVVPVIEAAINAISPMLQAKSIRIETVFPKDVGLILGDSTRLQQVIWNLLSNATKFSHKDGQIDLVVKNDTSDIEIIVSDKGEGIEPEFLPHVFDRFRQADGTTTRRHSGLGLGLAIVSHLVSVHGGTVHAESEGIGKGATFTVKLPLAKEIKTYSFIQPLKEDKEELPKHILSEVRVLVVDDEPDVCTLISVILKQYGAVVSTALSAQEALTTIDKGLPDILISDIGMPEFDGYDLIHEVKKRYPQATEMLPSIALTAYARPMDKQNALNAGFHSHLTKPVQTSTLIRTIASLTKKAVSKGEAI